MEVSKIKGVPSLLARIKAVGKKYGVDEPPPSVVVGYATDYALYVHEDLTKAHGEAFNVKHADEIAAGTEHSRGPNQQAKFLEQPARQNRDSYKQIIFGAMKEGKTLKQALLLAGLQLQRDSMEIVPVDTGILKASAFTRVEGA
jgi:hypothetical protein